MNLKKKTISLMLVLLLIVCSIPLMAQEVSAATGSGICGDNLTWSLTDDGTLTVSGTGAMRDYTYGNAPWYSNKNSITAIKIGSGVTHIGNYAFYGCNNLQYIDKTDIAGTVTSIGSYAFANISGLEAIELPGTVQTIGDYAFYKCAALSYVTLNSGTTAIGAYAFDSCGALTTCNLPGTLKSIGAYAFNGCDDLSAVTLPSGLTSIGDYAFNGCSGIKKLTVPGTVETVGSHAFYGTTIKELTLEEGIAAIGDYAFFQSYVTSLTIPGSVKTIGEAAFYGSSQMTALTLSEGITTIGDSAFSGCYALSALELPDSVTTIGAQAFAICGMSELEISANVTSIGERAFNGCYNLTKLTVDANNPNYSCDEQGVLFNKDKTVLIETLLHIYGTYEIPAGVTTISNYAFSEAETIYDKDRLSMTGVTIPGSVTAIGANAFAGTALTGVQLPENLNSIGEYAFAGTKLTTVDVPGSVKTMGTNTFYNCRALTDVTLEEGITAVMDGTFKNCAALENVDLPETVTSIGSEAFSNCTALKIIVIPKSVTSIGSSAFYDSGLTEVTIRGNVTTIGNYAFKAGNLTAVYFEGNAPTTIGTNTFKSISATAYYPEGNTTWTSSKRQKYGATSLTWTAYVPDIASGECGAEGDNLTWVLAGDGVLTISGTGDMADYAANTMPWNDYSNRITGLVLESGVNSVGAYAFYNCGSLVNVSIADTVGSIGGYAFYNCYNLPEITIPGSVSDIGAYAFFQCSQLKTLVLEDGVGSIGMNAFRSCLNLTEVVIPGSVTTVGNRAFQTCVNMTSVTVGSGVESIGSLVFMDCDGLKEVNFMGDAPVIGGTAFNGLTLSAYYPCGNNTWTDVTGKGYGGTISWEVRHVAGAGKAENEIPADCTENGSYDIVILCAGCGKELNRVSYVEEALGHDYVATEYEPTCADAGYTEYICSRCDDSYTEEGAPATGKHNYETEVVDPTCVDEGYTVYHCTECQDEHESDFVPATGVHNYEAMTTYDPTCVDYGYTDYRCDGCGEWKEDDIIPATGEHDWLEDGDGGYYCADCDAVQVHEHTYETEVVDPTCVDEGYTIHRCTGCDYEYESDFVPATGVHNYEAMTTYDPTCVDYGYTDYRCDGCGEWKEDDIIPATGEHDWLEDGDGGYYCANCDAVSGGEHEHDYQYTGGQEPTCADGGYEVYTCDGCGDSYTVDLAPTGDHDWQEDDEGNYYCGNCGASEGGGHEHDYQVSDTQDPTCGEWGYTEYTCTGCGDSYRDDLEPTGSHSYEGTVTEPNCTDRGYTTYTCTGCGDSYDDDYVDPNGAHDFVDGICTICGAEEEITYDMSVAGANMSLGSELAVNFFVKKVDIDTSKDYYIQVTKTYADGRADVTKTYYFQKGEWMDYNSTYYGVKFNGVAAKEMADKLYVQVFHADATPASDVWTDSIRDYAMRMFGKGTNEKKTMYVDMLNYGAAAQTEFGYGTDDLANSKLTAEHQAYATQTIAYANNRVEGENYYGTNLNLGSSIALNMYFQNVSQDMYAIATYTDHYGNEKEVRIEGSAFVLNKASTNGYRISINTLAVADVRQLVTCTVYNTDGTVVGTCTDSVEGYIARKANSSALYDAIMRFATSAYNSFH